MRRPLVAGVAALLACRAGPSRSAGPGPETGQLDLTWSDTAGKPVRFLAPATARWCGSDSLLEIMGARGDTAIGIVLLTGDSSAAGLGTGPYAVMPARVFIPWRPRAIAALRVAGSKAIYQFESVNGQVAVTGSDRDGVSGQVDLRLTASEGIDSLRVTGSFRKVRSVVAPPPCGRIDRPRGG